MGNHEERLSDSVTVVGIRASLECRLSGLSGLVRACSHFGQSEIYM